MDLYTRNALQCSKSTTLNYSTSFSLGVWMLDKKFRPAIYAIYAFVRFADEIVDTFFEQDREKLLKSYAENAYKAIEEGFSTNPVLHSFQWAVNKYNIEHELIEAFFYSMKMDLHKKIYNRDEYQRYIYGSAEVVGLMCLKVFCYNDDETYNKLAYPARKLGEALQKVNFLRDMKSDFHDRGRVYFPDVSFEVFDDKAKKAIEAEIAQDFKEAYKGIQVMKKNVRLGVLLAYSYYIKLFKKIRRKPPEELAEKRMRISNLRKMILLIRCYVKNAFM